VPLFVQFNINTVRSRNKHEGFMIYHIGRYTIFNADPDLHILALSIIMDPDLTITRPMHNDYIVSNITLGRFSFILSVGLETYDYEFLTSRFRMRIK
jgi:hypothetical protein